MPYTPTTWVSGTTPVDATEMNNLETQYTEATNSLEQDLLTPCVLSGLVATKDGTTANQLDVTAGVAFLKQADNTLRRRAPAATNFTTATPSTTYYLDLNPDGTWSWGTAHSSQSNYLTVCSVTTDASGNISVVTDARTLNATLLSGLGQLTTPPLVASAFHGTADSANALNSGANVPGGTLGKSAAGDMGDWSLGGGNSYIKGGPGGTNSSRIRFQPNNGTTVAAFLAGTGTNLIVNNGFQYGSGGADDAEYYYAVDDAGPADVVCLVEDAAHGGGIARCTHDDCASAMIVSTAPASAHGRPNLPVRLQTDRGPVDEWEPDPDPHWQPIAQTGRVPARYSGALTAYVVGHTEVVSAGDGTVRPARPEDRHIIGVVASVLSDVAKRPLPPGCILIALT